MYIIIGKKLWHFIWKIILHTLLNIIILSNSAKGSDDLLKNGLSLPPGVISLRPAVSGSRKHSAESDDSSASGGSDGLFKVTLPTAF